MTKKDKVSCHLVFALDFPEVRSWCDVTPLSVPKTVLEQYMEAGNVPQNKKSPAKPAISLFCGQPGYLRGGPHDTADRSRGACSWHLPMHTRMTRLPKWQRMESCCLGSRHGLPQPSNAHIAKANFVLVEKKLKAMSESTEKITDDKVKSRDDDIEELCSTYDLPHSRVHITTLPASTPRHLASLPK